ncbi:MAG: rhodanese-like domain-containing protein [Pseudomonadota bacterium]|nr:rhodanese-like domain-containing protein [Pseudomonadota bacterium]
MKPGAATVAVALIVLLIPSAMAAGKKYPDNVMRLVDEARRNIRTVDIEPFKKVWDRKDYDLLVDVREPREYQAVHIPGAINVPRGVIEFAIWKHVGFPAATHYGIRAYLYCLSGKRCALATRSLQDLGFTNLTSVNMHFREWVNKGYPLEFGGE